MRNAVDVCLLQMLSETQFSRGRPSITREGCSEISHELAVCLSTGPINVICSKSVLKAMRFCHGSRTPV